EPGRVAAGWARDGPGRLALCHRGREGQDLARDVQAVNLPPGGRRPNAYRTHPRAESVMATRYQITASRNVAASAARVYDILSDYRNGHPNILPSNFRNLHVERGGRGAGTVITFEVRAFGQTQSFRHTVEEPEPGRVLI